MPSPIHHLLTHRATWLVARIVLTFPFWGSGLAKLLDFQGGVAEMRQFGLEPAVLFNVAVFTTQLAGSALVIANRHAWLGAGALGVFTALTIPIVHRFWALDGAEALHAFHTAAEHVGMIGALACAAILSARAKAAPDSARSPSLPTVIAAR